MFISDSTRIKKWYSCQFRVAMPDRDLDITKFSFFAYRKLKKTLGEFDAVVECNEIAIREFVEQANKEDSHKYIQGLSLKHKIKVDDVDFLKFSSRIRQYYVASVFQQSEQFLMEFKTEWLKYFNSKIWIEQSDGETKLSNIIKNLGISLSSDLINIYNYYRLVRNYMSHTDRDVELLNNMHKKITRNNNIFLREVCLSYKPNELDSIDYTDFFILTNIVKHIAYVMSTSSKPENDRIAHLLFDLSKKNGASTYNGLKKIKNNQSRYESAIESFITTTYGRFSTNDLGLVSKKFKSLLA